MIVSKSRHLARAVAVSACLAVAGLAGAQSSSAAATKTCTVPKYPNANPGGYFTSLKATNVTCASARKLAVAYYKRCPAGKRGVRKSCSGKTVNGLKCTESRPADSQTESQINARVTCKAGSKKVVHTYQQNVE